MGITLNKGDGLMGITLNKGDGLMGMTRHWAVAVMFVAALGLAGCGGGGGSATPPATSNGDTAMQEAKQAQMAALEEASADLRVALAAVTGADMVTAEQLTAATDALAALEMKIGEAVALSDAEKARYQQRVAAAKELDLEAKRVAAIRRDITGDQLKAAMDKVEMITDTSEEGTVTAAEAAIAAAKTAIDGADIPEVDKQKLRTALAMHEGGLAQAKAARERAAGMKTRMAADMARDTDVARGKAMFDALHGPAPTAIVPLTNTALKNLERARLAPVDGGVKMLASPRPLWVNAAAGAGTLETSVNTPDLKIGRGEPADGTMLKGWKYRDYSHTAADTGTNRARVYSSRKDPEKKRPEAHFVADKPTYVNTYDAAERTVNPTTAPHSGIKSPEFPLAGTRIFRDMRPSGQQIKVQGTFDGAPGHYLCTPTGREACSAGVYYARSEQDDLGISLSDGWTFVHDEGATVDVYDEDFYYFGWWVREDAEGMPVAASAFWHAREINGWIRANQGRLGTATYVGLAAGLYGIKSALIGGNDIRGGGDFTADVVLDAVFGSVSNAGLTGTIDNFRLNGGDTDPGWSVKLERALWAGGGEIVNTPNNTSWTIGTTKAPKSGTWEATVYDSDTSDGKDTPTDIGGIFYTEFGNTHRMVGAFGAKRQE